MQRGIQSDNWWAWILITALIVIGGTANAATAGSSNHASLKSTKSECAETAGQLAQMHKAQAQLLKSFVQKNETMASTL